LTEQDLIQLNAYLDGELSAAERAEIDARLAADERLQAEFESLRVTAALLGMTRRVRVPRNFTLDPAVYGRPAPTGWWARLGLSTLPTWATAGITVLVVLVCFGALLAQMNLMRGVATEAPMMAAQAPEEAAEATEAPAEEEPAALPASKEGAEDASTYGMATEAPAPTDVPAPAPTLLPPSAGGGVGGGPSESMMTAGADSLASATPEPSLDERNAARQLEQTEIAAASLPEGETFADTTAPPLPEGAELQAYTANFVTPTSTPEPGWAEGQFLGVPVAVILLVTGAVALIAGLALIRAAIRRRSS
jgi:anti-sigma factor RsiW